MCDLKSFKIEPYRRKALLGYFERMSKDNPIQLWDDHIAGPLLEQGFSIEEDPRSVYKVEKLYAALAKYAPDNCPQVDVNDPHIQKGIAFARACFANKGAKLTLPQFTVDFVRKVASNPQGSSGLTAYGLPKAASFIRAYERGLQIAKGEKAPEPCIAFKRTQFNDKTRLVWGYPYSVMALEGLFARPLINLFKNGQTPMAFAMTTVALGAKMRVASYHFEYAYSTDVSSFDSSIPAEFINIAFDILSTWFDLNLVEPESGVDYRTIWNIVKSYFVTSPIVMPDGRVYKGRRHGVPSGSYFTQMIDSVVNAIVVGTLSSRFSLHVEKLGVFILGDDILFWSNRFIDLNIIASYATQTLGMKFNAGKSAQFRRHDVIHFLGRDWHNGVPDLPESEILKRMVQPERYRKYPKDPKELERQVNLLYLSYASVYRSAWRICEKALIPKFFWNYTPSDMERDLLVRDGRMSNTIDPNRLSGLERFRRIYQDESSRTYTPTALQFWK